jgi:DNA polymerase lambda
MGAKVGVEFYEQFQEKMCRHEVHSIWKIVNDATKKYFPDAEIDIMGSYRRGKLQCGDVDVLITHEEYPETVPRGVHILSTFPPYRGSQSYMGVFKSPTTRGKHRRIDIKFYPYAEKVYSMIYFTGNGYFNRSIRLFAQRKRKWKLNDHGLFFNALGTGRRFKAKTEKDVFDKLGLMYKDPIERDGFDAVVETETNEVYVAEKLSQQDLVALKDVKWVD